MAEIAFGVLGLPGLLDICIKYGNKLVQACKDYRDADAKLSETYLRIQNCCSRIVTQLQVTQELSSVMADAYIDVQAQTLQVLRLKLETAIQHLAKCNGRSTSIGRKLQFLSLRSAIKDTLKDLESWQKRYEPSWLFLIKLAPPSVDSVLNRVITTEPHAVTAAPLAARRLRRAFKEATPESQSVFIREKELDNYHLEQIPYSVVRMASTSEPSSTRLIVDDVVNDTVSIKDVRDFARRLRDSDPATFGILSCKGVVRQAGTSSMLFLFRLPETCTAVSSFRHLLLAGQTDASLLDCLQMAKQLASAVYYVHLYGYVHKNIRPETVLRLDQGPDKGEGASLTCLVGFQAIRNADGQTHRMTGAEWAANLYRHPSRQRYSAEYYVMQHDIYSLGVCLLEIGMWESFVEYGDDGVARPASISGFPQDGRQVASPVMVKGRLVELSRSRRLRARMGTKYSQVVETCLTCLDEGNTEFGFEEEFQDEDGIKVGVRYISKVLDILHDISM